MPLSAVTGTPMVVDRRGGDLASGSPEATWVRICRASFYSFDHHPIASKSEAMLHVQKMLSLSVVCGQASARFHATTAGPRHAIINSSSAVKNDRTSRRGEDIGVAYGDGSPICRCSTALPCAVPSAPMLA